MTQSVEAGRPPSVSVCLPAFNGEQWIASAIESVLAQTYEGFELVISDGGSGDGTAAVARAYRDRRIRVDVAPRKLQAIGNWNRSVLLSRGALVKFLHQDDTLDPTCLEEMVSLAFEDTGIGLVFARRKIVLEQPATPANSTWAQTYRDLQRGFTSLDRVNDGRDLFRQLLDAKLEENWIGEPSSVLVTRRCLHRIGLFDLRLRQVPDLGLWCRALLHFRVGFVDSELSTYMHHSGSLTGENERLGHAWLDRLWLYQGLLEHGVPEPERGEVRRLRREAVRAAVRTQAGRLLRGRFSGELVHYALHRIRSSIGRAPSAPPLPSDEDS